jgi:hypothetical protein
MSTLAFAEFTTKREEAAPGSSSSQNPPGVSTFVDALAALVPAEVLTLHAIILSVTTKVDNATTTITDAVTLHRYQHRTLRRAPLSQVGQIRLPARVHPAARLRRLDDAAKIDGF